MHRVRAERVYADSGGGRWCEVFVDTYRSPSGGEAVRHRVRIGRGRTGVVVLARRGQDTLLVRQWRPTVGRWAWELPRGFGESDPAADAMRELHEEAGLVGTSAVVLAHLDVDSGMLDSEVAVVSVTVPEDARLQADASGDGEIQAARWWNAADLRNAVRAGELRDAFTLAALGVAGMLHD